MKTHPIFEDRLYVRSFLLFTLFLLCTLTTVFAQGKVSGTITDAETQMPIEAATVELLNYQDSSLVAGVITNKDGTYNFDGVNYGGYLLRASFLGYDRKYIDAFGVTPDKPEVKFSKTAMAPDATSIDEVSVYARMMTGTIEDDKIIYVVNPKAAEIAQSGLELLRQVPDCQVDFMTNNVTLEGSTNILYLVNGKQVEKDYLMQLNPQIIDKYEIMTNPGVKYDASFDAVINVILKRDLNYGLSFHIRSEVPTSRSFFSNSNAGVDFFHKNIRFFANTWGGASNWDVKFDTDRYTEYDTLYQRFHSKNNGNMYFGFNYGFDWFINDKTTLNFFSTVKPRLKNENDYHTDTYRLQDDDSLYSYMDTKEFEKNYFNDYSLYYQRKLEKEGQDISAEVYFSTNNKFKNKADLFSGDSSSLQINDDFKDSYRLKADYNYPLTATLKLSIGIAGEYNLMENNYTLNPLQAEDNTNTINYDELRYAAYGNLAYKIKQTNFQAGVRYEHSDIAINYNHKDTTNQYDEFLPFLSVQTKVGKKQTLRLNYRRSIDRPGLNQINPFSYRNDQFSYTLGNPNLKPGKIHNIEFNHRINLVGPLYINYKPYVKMKEDDIELITGSDSGAYVAGKYQNIGSSVEYGIKINGNLTAAKWFMVSPSFTYYHKDIEKMEGIDGLNKNMWRLHIGTHFILPKDWVLFLDYNANAPRYNHEEKIEQTQMVVGGFYKKLNERWSVTAFTLNPFFHKYEFEKKTIDKEALYQQSAGYINYTHVLNIRIQYNFNVGKDIKKVDRDIQQDKEAEQGGGGFF